LRPASAVDEVKRRNALGAGRGTSANLAIRGTSLTSVIDGICAIRTSNKTGICIETVGSNTAGTVGGSPSTSETSLVTGSTTAAREVSLRWA
jgi:hypothetical protein